MTWVIGRAGPFGHAVGLSDIRVTLPDGSERDCLRKVYRVGPQLVLGFAGSVQIGLEIAAQLTFALDTLPENRSWDPRLVARDLPIGTSELFRQFPPRQRRLGCQLMLLSAHPVENDGPAPFARCFVHRFEAPDFLPVETPGAQIVSIGSGANIKPYVDALETLSRDMEMFTLEVGFPGGSGVALMMSVSSLLKRNPSTGISQRIHLCLVGRDKVRLGSNTREEADAPEDERMPPLATNMDELRSLLHDHSAADISLAMC